jgi:hypothetical protein
MPRTINASTDLPQISLSAEVPVDTESIDASDLVIPVQALLDNDGFLYRRQQIMLQRLDELGRQSASFQLQSSVTSLLVEPARTYTFTGAVRVQKFGGLTADTTVTAINAPAGVTVTVTPNPVASSADLTITTTSNIVAGQYDLILRGEAGGRVQDIRIPLTLTSATQPATFSVTAPGVVAIDRALNVNTTTAVLNISREGGFNSPINFSADLPAGLAASFSPAQVTGSSTLQRAATTMTLTALSTVPVGTYNVLVRAVSGVLVRTVALTLSVSKAPSVGVPDFSLRLEYDAGDPLTTNGATLYIDRANGYNGPVFLRAAQPYTGASALARFEGVNFNLKNTGPLITINNALGIIRVDGNAARITADGVSQGWFGSGIAPYTATGMSWATSFIVAQETEESLGYEYGVYTGIQRYISVDMRRGNRTVY